MSWEKNAYYHPEALGLTVVAELEYSDQNYNFDTQVVWKDGNGLIYTARDSGCSCPTPFEDYCSVESLERVGSYEQLESELDRGWGNPNFQSERRDFLDAVKAAFD